VSGEAVGEVVLRRVEVGGAIMDVRIVGPTVAEIGPGLRPSSAAVVLDGDGGALIPGLHDHHIHLLATAAAATSVPVGPLEVRNADGLAAALRGADHDLAPGRWLRAIGYHESVAGDLERSALDALVPDRPVRLQHRTGARWVLNTAAIDALGLAAQDRPELERDAGGRLTGRLHRGDDWLRTLFPHEPPPDLTELGARLAACGVTGVTDATPYATAADLGRLRDAVASGALPQRVVVTGGPELAGTEPPPGLVLGPVKVLIDDGAYPDLDELAGWFAAAHAHRRAVAVHCVTRTALVLALAAWDVAGSHQGDRVEHGSVIPPELVEDLRRHHLTVVTQPAFVAERGDEYLRDVDADDIPHLYPCGRLLAAGVPVAGSTDAPYTDPDPWRTMRAAVARTAPSGAVLGADERVTAEQALALFLGAPHRPGGPPRLVEVGAPGDLCLLRLPLAAALERLSADAVRTTICQGRVVTPPG
jgi:predicted amidohydrolase YtcJ